MQCTMFNMKINTTSLKLADVEPRSNNVGLRMRASDVTALRKLAKASGVGLSTFARMILEAYVHDHAKK